MVGLKRGVSAVVASVLLILLVLVVASVIFAFARGIVEDNMDETEVGQCELLDLRIGVVSRVGIQVDIEIVNRGGVNVSSFQFKVFLKDGSSEFFYLDSGVDAGSAGTWMVDFAGIFFDSVEEVEIYPVLGSGTNEVICRDEDIYLVGW